MPSAYTSPRCVTALRSWTDRIITLRQISVTALFYLEDSREIHHQGLRACELKDAKRRAPQHAADRELALDPLFFWGGILFLYVCVFFSPGPVLCKLGQPGVLFVLPEVLTPVLGPFFVLFSRAFLFLIF